MAIIAPETCLQATRSCMDGRQAAPIKASAAQPLAPSRLLMALALDATPADTSDSSVVFVPIQCAGPPVAERLGPGAGRPPMP